MYFHHYYTSQIRVFRQALSISDPSVARDNSPDPRQHSTGEIVPDLIAYKSGFILVIEAKPQYSLEDKEKLHNLLWNLKERLIFSLKKFSSGKEQFASIDYDSAEYVPVLSFGNPTFRPPCNDSDYGHIY
jgi:hypothetical protein